MALFTIRARVCDQVNSSFAPFLSSFLFLFLSFVISRRKMIVTQKHFGISDVVDNVVFQVD